MNPFERVASATKLRVERGRARFGWFDVAVETLKRFSRDDGGSYTAALTYYAFFSLFPILLFSASIVGFLTAGNESLRQAVLDAGLGSIPLLRDVLSPSGLQAIETKRGALAITGMVMALYSGTGAVVALEHALNRFNGITDEPNWFMKRLRSLRFLALFGVAVIASLVLGTLAGFATDIFSPREELGGQRVRVTITREASEPPAATIRVGPLTYTPAVGESFAEGYVLESVNNDCATVSKAGTTDTLCVPGGRGLTLAAMAGILLGHVIGFLVGLMIFAGAFKLLPAVERTWKDVLPGAAIAAGAFEVLKQFGASFLQRGSGSREAAFGVFAISAALLVACFLMSQVTLMAAEVNNVLIARRATRQNQVPDKGRADGSDD
jgi:uncharacterized BrkB/YihY/UPF0761 family membrane protein